MAKCTPRRSPPRPPTFSTASRTQVPPSVDQFSVIASCSGVIATEFSYTQGRGNLRRGRACRIRLSGDPRRGSHLQAVERRTSPDRRVPSAGRRLRPRSRPDPSPDRRSDHRYHRPPGEAPQPRSRRRIECPGGPQSLDHDRRRPASRRRSHAAARPQDRDGERRHLPAGNGPSARQRPA